jgi:DnaJ-class molecular chaperone
MICRPCTGSGMSPFAQDQYCSLCKGRGELPDDPKRTVICKPCTGMGISAIKMDAYCDLCGGYGMVAPLGSA